MVQDSTRIRVIMALLGVTSKDFAVRVGVSQGVVTGWSKGRYAPQRKSREALAAICQAEGIAFLPSGMPVMVADLVVVKENTDAGEGARSSV